jgi:uncharacterized RDD family membrane protein YckC
VTEPQSSASTTRLAGYPAGLGRRLGAMLYDSLLILALFFLTGFIWVALSGDVVTGLAFQITLLAEIIGFFVYCWRKQGETLGMRAWKLRILDASGQLPSMGQIALRLLLAPVSMACFGLGYLWLYLGQDKQTWHDRVSATFVLHVPDRE